MCRKGGLSEEFPLRLTRKGKILLERRFLKVHPHQPFSTMRFIPTKLHGLLDYASGLLFIASPWLFGFNLDERSNLAENVMAQWIPVFVGVGVLVYSIFTDYELGLIRRLPMPVHLTADFWFAGVFLAASPWIFGFADRVYLPHVLLGAFSIGAGLLTKKETSDGSHRVRHAA
jgi:hypothetical protein